MRGSSVDSAQPRKESMSLKMGHMSIKLSKWNCKEEKNRKKKKGLGEGHLAIPDIKTYKAFLRKESYCQMKRQDGRIEQYRKSRNRPIAYGNTLYYYKGSISNQWENRLLK